MRRLIGVWFRSSEARYLINYWFDKSSPRQTKQARCFPDIAEPQLLPRSFMINRAGISAPVSCQHLNFPSDGYWSHISVQVLLVSVAQGTPPMKRPVEGGLRTWLGSHGDYQQPAIYNPLLLRLKTKRGYWQRPPVENTGYSERNNVSKLEQPLIAFEKTKEEPSAQKHCNSINSQIHS